MKLQIKPVHSAEELSEVVSLCHAFRSWLTERYPEHDWANDSFYSPARWEELMSQLGELHAPPDGTILLARLDGAPAGCVMLKKLAPQVCEMKRLFVHPDRRGHGVGAQLCQALIAEAKALGYQTMRLDTGIRHHEAQALYRSLGFRQIDAYYDCPEELREVMLFMELDLTGGEA